MTAYHSGLFNELSDLRLTLIYCKIGIKRSF